MTTRVDTISSAQLRLIMASYRGVDRADRLQRISLIVSRRIDSTLDLSPAEASVLIDHLETERWQPSW